MAIVIVTDFEGRILDVSADAAAALNLTPRALARRRLDMFVERDRELLGRQMEIASRGHTVRVATVLRPRERALREAVIQIERADPSGSIAELKWHIELGPSLGRRKMPEAATRPRPVSGMVPPSVLIVDDNADTLELLGHTLRTAGLPVVTATRARAALGILDVTRPGVIVTDLLMPGLSGWDFIREVRATRAYDAIPIVVISAVASPDLSSESVAAVFRKPLDPLDLAHALRDMMSAPPTRKGF
jgi:CheY-like chemotaxis protein